MRRLAFVAVLAAVASILVLGTNGRRALAATSVLDVGDGAVFLTRDGVEGAAREGASLSEGDVLRTGDDGHAVVLFFDGSTLALEASTTIRIESAHSDGASTILQIAQIAGTTWHSVHKLLDPGSRYEVTTPGLVAAVRGTAFQVDVGDGDDNVTTEEGAVDVTAQSQTVRVTPGFRSQVPHGDRPHPAEQAPRPTRVLTLELVDGGGAVLDAARRAVGVAPDGSLRNAIPGARVERDGRIVRLVIPNPTRAMRFVPGRSLTDVRYSILDARGQVLASGEAAPKTGPLAEAFDRLAGAVPDATPTPSPARPRLPLPTFTPPPGRGASASPATVATPPTRTAAASPMPADVLPTPLPSPSVP